MNKLHAIILLVLSFVLIGCSSDDKLESTTTPDEIAVTSNQTLFGIPIVRTKLRQCIAFDFKGNLKSSKTYLDVTNISQEDIQTIGFVVTLSRSKSVAANNIEYSRYLEFESLQIDSTESVLINEGSELVLVEDLVDIGVIILNSGEGGWNNTYTGSFSASTRNEDGFVFSGIANGYITIDNRVLLRTSNEISFTEIGGVVREDSIIIAKGEIHENNSSVNIQSTTVLEAEDPLEIGFLVLDNNSDDIDSIRFKLIPNK